MSSSSIEIPPVIETPYHSVREVLLKQWAVVALFILFLLLVAAHSFMIHYHRPDAVISWCENMITGTFTAMIAKLK